MRILWASNAPWVATGYGQQTNLFLPRLARDHDVAAFAHYGLHGSKMEWNGFEVYPSGADAWGNDVLPAYAAHHFEGDPRAGWVITLQDAWTLVAPALQELRLAAWTPVDHDPAPPAVVGFFQRFGAVPIAMSRYGQAKLGEQGIAALYVPHGVDTSVYHPAQDPAAVRDALGISRNAFVVGMVGANKGIAPPRKAFAEAFEGFARFKEKHPEAVLYVHTLRTDGHGGCNLLYLAACAGLDPDEIVWCDQLRYMMGAITDRQMALLYSMMDVLLHPSYGEGFGVPIIEAQACGTPVIVAENSAQPELCGSGWTVPCERFWDERQRAYYGRPVVEGIADALERATLPSAASRRAVEFAAAYDADRVYEEHWKPVLADLERTMETPQIEARPVDLAAIG